MKTALTAALKASEFAPIILKGSLADSFALASELGYDGVEIHLQRPGDADRRELQGLGRRFDQQIPTIGTGMAAGAEGLCFTHPDPALREAAVQRILDHIDLAADIGSGVTIGLLYGIMGRNPAPPDKRRALAVSCLEQCCRAAEKKGVALFLEPLNRYESEDLNTIDQVIEIIDAIGSPQLKILADTFHMNIEERDPADSLRRAGKRLGHVHLVDTNREALGRGHLDVESMVGALQEAGYRGFVSFENLPRPDSRQAARQAIERLRRAL